MTTEKSHECECGVLLATATSASHLRGNEHKVRMGVKAELAAGRTEILASRQGMDAIAEAIGRMISDHVINHVPYQWRSGYSRMPGRTTYAYFATPEAASLATFIRELELRGYKTIREKATFVVETQRLAGRHWPMILEMLRRRLHTEPTYKNIRPEAVITEWIEGMENSNASEA